MIARLTGRLVEKQPHQVIIEAGGVGYRAFIPLSTYYTLPDEGAEVTLRTHTHLREDVIALYGFSSPDEQELFERLIEISGIGPRLALAMLSGLSAADLVDAIVEGDAGRLRGIPGVGPKTADRVVLELRDRVRRSRSNAGGESAGAGGGPAGSSAMRRDVVSALVNLGYRESLAESAVRRALDGKQANGAALQEVLKRSLRYLAS
ncbi:MAG TPA: Holliday junction branch migration protein RuvA [Patescibacteria group bacterium]|nr:Holliday junction branch migration protein RuvA [Patescibacteria group bacterium]